MMVSISQYKLFCIVGPSGTGKDTVCSKLQLPKVISYRTRDLRPGETDGVNGHFITKEKFFEMDKQNMWLAKTKYANNYYGITQGELMELETSPMLYVIDWEGVEKLKDSFSKIEGYSPNQIVSVFIHTPREDLETRMLLQGRQHKEIKVRLDRADLDYATSSKCDYVIMNRNGKLEEAAIELANIFFKESFRK